MTPQKALAGDIVVFNFGGGLDTLDSPAVIDPSMAQDILNVNIQPGGGSIYKRDGYGLFQALNVSTSPVHGGYHFQTTGGNDVQLWGSDNYLYGIVNDAAYVKLATGTFDATWQCADSQGFAYCLSSSRDSAVKTDGTSANTSYQSGIPLGTMLTFTPTQLVVAGVSGNESTIYISQQNTFTTFTVGTLPSSAFTEPIASPGSRITHLAYYFGKLFWWKDQSFGYATFSNQNDWQLTIVSNQIGTLDNSDAFWNSSGYDSGTKFSGTAQANAEKSPGGIFFRGQDNHLYVYDGYYLTRLSRVITPTVSVASRKKSNSFTLTSQAEWQTGTSSPTVPTQPLSFTASAGDVVPGSFTVIENSSTQWTNGTASNLNVGVSSIALTTNNSGNINNNSFESTCSNDYTFTGNASFPFSCTAAETTYCGTVTPIDGTKMSKTADSVTGWAGAFQIIDLSGNVLNSTALFNFDSCAFQAASVTPSQSNIGKRVKFRIFLTSSGPGNRYYTTNSSYILGGPIGFYYTTASNGSTRISYFDDITSGSSTITSGSFTSQAINTNLPYSFVYSSATWLSTSNPPSFVLQTSTSTTGKWTDLTYSTNSNSQTNTRYLRYLSTFTVTSDTGVPVLKGVNLVAMSSGTYFSAVQNAPSLTSWDTFSPTYSNGNGSHSFYIRSSTYPFYVFGSSPPWTAQSAGSVVSASTGTYFQFIDSFTITSATGIPPSLNLVSINWFEGSAADKAYMTYFNDAIWFSVSASSSVSTNNRIFYWDILNGAWTIYDIPSNGFLVENNRLYFGDPTAGKLYKFGSVTTDNGLAINSYWRSKAFLGADPFVQNEFIQADFVLGQSSTTLTYTYTLDSKTATAYTMTAYDPFASLIQRNFLLPVGKIGKYYDFEIGDNSSAPAWLLMGHRARYNALNWKPMLN